MENTSKLSLWLKMTFIFYLIQNLTRTILISLTRPNFFITIQSFFDGFLWDTTTWLVLSLPLLILTMSLKIQHHEKFKKSIFYSLFSYLFIFILICISACEIFFWMEFRSRFNFIAVDYLIYTNEVLANLKESFPMDIILISTIVISLFIGLFSDKIEKQFLHKLKIKLSRLSLSFLSLILPLGFVLGLTPWLDNRQENYVEQQLARNGMYEFVRAFRSNEIDYEAFYKTISKEKARTIVKNIHSPRNQSSLISKNKKPNVVIIVVESLGAKFIAPLGGKKDTTPFLNKLSKESIFFTHFYATGTRTVRGLEAINLSIPPTPGYAVVKRPEHKGLYSLGNTFKVNNYEPIFLYGGNGFFDNMNSFFGGNGFQVIDNSDFEKSEVSFKNAWGVCDEDLFNKAKKIISQRSSRNPFLLFMLTTSNHRPFTYPENKIDIPSGTGRDGAVKYTDFAIGNFLNSVKNEKWAQNTIFVVVADHSTEGRGYFNLEVSDFHVPLWIYSPLIKPQTISKTASQIDLLPTLIDLLNLNDSSPFFGHSLLNTDLKEERAFIGNYQHVGYFKNGLLTTLGPNKVIEHYAYDRVSKNQSLIQKTPYDEETISYYQVASEVLKNGEYKLKK